MTTRQKIAEDALADLTAQVHDRADRVLMQRLEDIASQLMHLAHPVKEIEFDIQEAFQSAQFTRARALPASLLDTVIQAVFEDMKAKNRIAHIEAFIERAASVDVEEQS